MQSDSVISQVMSIQFWKFC